MVWRTAAAAALLASGIASGGIGAQESAAARPALLARLAGDAFFAKLPLRAAPGFPPIDLVLQEPYGARAGWEAAPSNRFGPWARELAGQFEARFAKPFALERGERFGPPGVVVLASEGDLVNFRRSDAGRRASSYGEASYDPGLDVVVVSATSSAPAVHLARFSGLQMLVYRELAVHGDPAAQRQPWLTWGLPAYLAWCTGSGPESLRTREIDRSSLRDWVLAGNGTNRAGTLLPLLELVGAADADAAAAALRRGAAAAGAKLSEDPSYLAWCAAGLWTHYLNDGEGGRWRDGYGAYLAGALRGRGDGLALREALQLDEAGVRALEQGFEVWVQQTGAALGLFVPESAAETPPPAAEPAPALPPIAPQPREIALTHGLALVLAREGDLDGAIAALEAAAVVDPEGPLAKRIARDLERARGFRDLRARFLADFAASGERLQLELDGKRINVRVAAVEADRITLREARAGLEAIPFAQLESFALARQMGREVGGAPTGWLRYWPYALVDDARWQAQLDAGESGAAELRADAAEWYPGALRLGALARELTAIGTGELPADPGACEALAERCASLVREHGALAEVETRRPALRARAAAALERAWRPERLGEGLAGRLEALPEGRARLTYVFDAQAELDELATGPMYPQQRAEGQPELLRGPEISVVHGGLRASGSHTWRLPLPFRAPLSARLQLMLGQIPDGATTFVTWALGACDDGQGNLVLVEGLGDMLVIDLPAGVSTSAIDTRMRSLDRKRYTIELRHDGKTASSWLEGKPCKELPASTRTSGDVLFSMHSDTPISFEELVLEGEIDADLVRARWLERRLVQLGF